MVIERSKCWSKITEMDIQVISVLKGTKAITVSVFIYWVEVICNLVIK